MIVKASIDAAMEVKRLEVEENFECHAVILCSGADQLSQGRVFFNSPLEGAHGGGAGFY